VFPPGKCDQFEKVIQSPKTFFTAVEVFYWTIDTDRQAFFIIENVTLPKFLGRSQEDREEHEVPKGHEWMFHISWLSVIS